MAEFVHLHVCSDYSLLAGMNRIPNLAARASQLRMPAVALTDRANMFGVMEFCTTVAATGPALKPIVGCEMPLRLGNQPKPIVLLATDQTGYKNLLQLSAAAAETKAKNGAPWVEFEQLQENASGLVGLSGGMRGPINHALLRGEADAPLDNLRTTFGDGRFFLELQNHHYPEQNKTNELLVAASKRLNLPLVATNEVYYLNKDDATAHEILLRIDSKKELTPLEKEGHIKEFSLPGEGYHFKTAEEMQRDFAGHEEALRNTIRIAEMCNLRLDKQPVHYPKYTLPAGETTSSFLRAACERELTTKHLADDPRYRDRLDYELSIIDRMGFSSYFLVVADFVNAAKQKNIVVGPGRGSAVGSLVAYATGITNVDPIEYGLLFERFLNPERISLPDVDIDFQENRRAEVINYCKEKYGSAQIAQIVTYGKLKAKAVLKDVARVFGLDFEAANKLSTLIGTAPTLEDAYKNQPAFKDAIVGNPALQNIYRYSLKLEGLTRQTGVHASGIIIADKPLSDYVPLTTDDDGNVLTQYEGKLLEDYCGLIKMDFLGLKTLSILEECVSLVERNKNIVIDLGALPLDDESTYHMLSNGRSLGVFQFESAGMQKYLKELRPTNLDDLTALNAMYRPGPMEWIPVYTARKNHQKPEFSEPSKREDFKRLVGLLEKYNCLKEIMGPTKGIPIYQEQIMEIGKNYAGFSLGRADLMRSAISKKKTEQFGSLMKEFSEGAKKKGYAESDSEFLFKKVIEPFGGYGFNKSHAVCYALVAYQTAYLKANHPQQFMAALLNSEISNTDKINLYIDEAAQLGIKVLPPDINQSDVLFSVRGNDLRYSLNAIKHVGEGLCRSIVQVREKRGPYQSFAAFLQTQADAINKQALESLIKAGCFEGFGSQPTALLNQYPQMLEAILRENNLKKGGQGTLFGEATTTSPAETMPTEASPANDGIDSEETLANYERTALGFLLRHNKIAQLMGVFNEHSPINFSEKSQWNDKKKVDVVVLLQGVRLIRTKKDQRQMAFLSIQNHTGTGEAVVFSEVFDRVAAVAASNQKPLLSEGNLLRIKASLQNRGGRQGLLVDSLEEFLVPKNVPAAPAAPAANATSNKTPSPVKKELCIEFARATITDSECLDLKRTLKRVQGGDCRVSLFVFGEGERHKIEADDLSISHSEGLLSDLQAKPFVGRVWLG